MDLSSFAHLRALYDLNALVERYTGRPITRRGIVCPMPHHTHVNHTPSFHTFVKSDGTQYFKCLGACGAMGDVIDFVGYMHLGAGYNPRDAHCVLEATGYLGQPALVVPRTWHRQTEKRGLNPIRARLAVEAWHQALDFPAQEYLERRGVPSVAQQFMLGYAHLTERVKFPHGIQSPLHGHYISIPHYQDGSVIGVKFRRIDSHPDYQGVPEERLPIRYDSMFGGHTGIYNRDAVAFHPGLVFMPEGEFDVMLLSALGFAACAPTCGANSWDDTLPLLLANAEVLLIEDPDPTGQQIAKARQSKLSNSRIVSTTPYKDVGDMYLRAGEAAVRHWGEQHEDCR
jgi:DNA primase